MASPELAPNSDGRAQPVAAVGLTRRLLAMAGMVAFRALAQVVVVRLKQAAPPELAVLAVAAASSSLPRDSDDQGREVHKRHRADMDEGNMGADHQAHSHWRWWCGWRRRATTIRDGRKRWGWWRWRIVS